jgi:hypothetical protein
VTGLDLPRGRCEVCHGNQYVIKFHGDERTSREMSPSARWC